MSLPAPQFPRHRFLVVDADCGPKEKIVPWGFVLSPGATARPRPNFSRTSIRTSPLILVRAGLLLGGRTDILPPDDATPSRCCLSRGRCVRSAAAAAALYAALRGTWRPVLLLPKPTCGEDRPGSSSHLDAPSQHSDS